MSGGGHRIEWKKKKYYGSDGAIKWNSFFCTLSRVVCHWCPIGATTVLESSAFDSSGASCWYEDVAETWQNKWWKWNFSICECRSNGLRSVWTSRDRRMTLTEKGHIETMAVGEECVANCQTLNDDNLWLARAYTQKKTMRFFYRSPLPLSQHLMHGK